MAKVENRAIEALLQTERDLYAKLHTVKQGRIDAENAHNRLVNEENIINAQIVQVQDAILILADPPAPKKAKKNASKD